MGQDKYIRLSIIKSGKTTSMIDYEYMNLSEEYQSGVLSDKGWNLINIKALNNSPPLHEIDKYFVEVGLFDVCKVLQ